jgi:hypothetical protein
LKRFILIVITLLNNKMYREEDDPKYEAMEQMAIDDNKQEGSHNDKWCGIGLRLDRGSLICSDCQRSQENKKLELVLNRFI